MTLQPLHLARQADARIVGLVKIDPSAAIAPGAILCAAPDSQIVVGAGVCIGMGVILNAYAGTIELGPGASLGPGVLVVGRSTIGANACIGGASTIFNADVADLQVLPAGSLLGDPSRRVEVLPPQAAAELDDPWETPPAEAGETAASEPEPSGAGELSKEPGAPVFGKVYVNQLLMTLFPQGQPFNRRDERT